MFSRSPAQPSPAAGARDPLPRFVQQAESLRESGDLDRAEELLVRGLRDHDGDPRARAALARVLADRGDTERAEGVWRDVLGLDPDYVPALRALADISEAAGRRDEAMGFFRRLIRVENAGFDFGHAGQEPQPAASSPTAAADVAAVPAIDPDADPAEVLRAASRAWETERAATGNEPSADPIPSFTPDERDVEQASTPLSFTPDDVDARHSHVRPSFSGDEPDAAPPAATLAFTADESDAAQGRFSRADDSASGQSREAFASPSFTADEPDAAQGRFSGAEDSASGQSREPFAPPSFMADEPDVSQGRFSRGDDLTSGQSREAFVAPSFTADAPHAEQSPFMRAADPSPQAHAAAPVPVAFHADAALQGAVDDSADFAEAEFDEWDDDEALAGFDIVFMDEDEAAEAAAEEPVAAAPPAFEPVDEAAVEGAAPLASEPLNEAAVEQPVAAAALTSDPSAGAAADEAPDAAAMIEAVASAEGVDESAWSDESFAPAESSAVDAAGAIEAVEGIDEAAWSDESFAPAEAGEDGFGPGFELPAIPVAEPAALEKVAEADEASDAPAEEGFTAGVADADEALDADVDAGAFVGAFAEADEPVSAAADADAFAGGITEADEPVRAAADADAFASGITEADEPVSAAADVDAFASGITEADEPVSAATDADAFGGGIADADGTVSAAADVAATADAMDAVEAPAAEPEPEPEPIADWLRAIDDADPTIAVVAEPYAAPSTDDRADEVDLAEAVDFGDEVDPAAAVDFADLAEPIGGDVEPVGLSAMPDDSDQAGQPEPAAADFAGYAEPIGAEPMDASATLDDSDAGQPEQPAAGYVFDDVVAGGPEALDAIEAYAAPAADEDAELDPPVNIAAVDAPPVDAGGWPTRARLPHGVTLDPEPSPLASAPEVPAPITTPQARPAARAAASLATPQAQPVDANPNFPPALPPDPTLARAWFDRATQRAPQEPKAPSAPSVALVAAPRAPWAPAPTLTGRANPVQLAQALVRVLERDGDVLGATSSVRRLLAVSIGRELGMEGTRLDGLALAAVLADLGGLFLRGGGQAQRGTDVSLTLLESVPLTPEVHEALAMQHRRWDGGDGGPREDGIPFPARVLAVARDAAALLTGPARRGTDAAVHELQRGAGTAYDPMVVSVLRRVLARRELYGIGYGVGGRVMVAHPRELRSMDLAGRLHASGFEAETPGVGTLRQRLHGDLPLALIVGAELAAAEADTLREIRAVPAAAWMPIVVVDADDAELRPSLLAAGADLCFASSATFTEVGAALNALLRRLSTLAGGTTE